LVAIAKPRPTFVRPTWIAHLVELRHPRPDEGAPASVEKTVGEMTGAGDRTSGLLTAALVPEKIALEHGASLEPALKEIGNLALIANAVEPWRRRQVERLLDSFYKVLALELAAAAPGERTRIAKASADAMGDLIERIGPGDQVLPAMFAATALFDSGVRLVAQKRLEVSAKEAAVSVASAATAVADLRDRLSGRAGVSAALNVFSNLVEQLERSAPKLTADERRDLWRIAADLLEATVPHRGFNQELAAHLSEHLEKALAQGEGPRAAADAVTQAVRAQIRASMTAAVKEMRKETASLPAKSAALEAAERLADALERTFAHNPLGPPALVENAKALHACAVQSLRAKKIKDLAVLWTSAAKIVDRFSEAAIGADVVLRTHGLLEKAVERDKANHASAIAAIAECADAPNLYGVARGLFALKLAIKNRTLEKYPKLEEAFPKLEELDPESAVAVSLAVVGFLNNTTIAAPMLTATIELAKKPHRDEPFHSLVWFVHRYASAASGLKDKFEPEQIARISERLAEITSAKEVENAAKIGDTLQAIVQSMPKVDPVAILESDPTGQGVLELVDPKVRYRHPPVEFLTRLLEGASVDDRKSPERQLEFVRLALALAAKIGNLDGNPDIPFERMLTDWNEALAKPRALKDPPRAQKGVAIRASGAGEAASYIRANPEMPIELAFTAGLRLDRDQLAWVAERLARSTRRDAVRALRDFVFACVDANKKTMIDVIRQSTSPSKAISGVMAEIAREYRAGRLGEILWKELREGLEKGIDPLKAIEERRMKEGLSKLDLEDAAMDGSVPGAVGAAAGKAMIDKCAPAIAAILKYYEQCTHGGCGDAGVDFPRLIAALKTAIKAVKDGTWPKVKYEGKINRRLLQGLTPEQEAIWRQEVVTPAKGEPPPVVLNQSAQTAMKLLAGVQKALPMEVRLDVGEETLPAKERPAFARKETANRLAALAWDDASFEALKDANEAYLTALRASEKGTPRHRALGRRIGLIHRAFSVLQLHLAIRDVLAHQKKDPAATLARLRPALANAEDTLRRAGALGTADAIEEVRSVAQHARAMPPRQGRYAVDEDSLEALIMSHTPNSGSCVNWKDGFRRWALAGSALDANIRMLRTYNGDKFTYRAFFKLFEVEFPGYKGPALWIDGPHQEGAAQGDDLSLLYRSAIRKAIAMGVPVMEGYGSLTQEAQKMGIKTKQASVRFSIDEGNTGVMHSDSMFGGYGNLTQLRGKNEKALVRYDAQIALANERR
jgi:hypothetical protein